MTSIKKTSLNFTGLLLILSAVYAGIYYLVNLFHTWSTAFYAYLILFVLFVFTTAAFMLQLFILKRAPEYSIHIIVGAIIVRLLVFGGFNFLMIYLNGDLAMENVVMFFAVYLGFTLLELVVLIRQIMSFKAF